MRRKWVFILCTLLCVWSAAIAQNTQVSGTVISADDGLPIIGATVLVKGTTIGTVTNIDGQYELSVPASSKILQFSYVGMTTAEAAVKPVVDITLKSDAKSLDEVVVTALGLSREKNHWDTQFRM